MCVERTQQNTNDTIPAQCCISSVTPSHKCPLMQHELGTNPPDPHDMMIT